MKGLSMAKRGLKQHTNNPFLLMAKTKSPP